MTRIPRPSPFDPSADNWKTGKLSMAFLMKLNSANGV